VQYEVEAQRRRVAQPRRGEGVVDHRSHASIATTRRQGLKVRDGAQRVGDRLDVEEGCS
jgi:hypothetical protein